MTVFAIIAIILPLYLTLPDTDDDGYHDVRELVVGCDPFDSQSFPYCIEWDTSTVVSCEPVSQLIPLVPCEL